MSTSDVPPFSWPPKGQGDLERDARERLQDVDQRLRQKAEEDAQPDPAGGMMRGAYAPGDAPPWPGMPEVMGPELPQPTDPVETKRMLEAMVKAATERSRQMSIEHWLRQMGAGAVMQQNQAAMAQAFEADTPFALDLIEAGIMNAGVEGMKNPEVFQTYQDILADAEMNVGESNRSPLKVDQSENVRRIQEMNKTLSDLQFTGETLGQDLGYLRENLKAAMTEQKEGIAQFKSGVSNLASGATMGYVGEAGSRADYVRNAVLSAFANVMQRRFPEGEQFDPSMNMDYDTSMRLGFPTEKPGVSREEYAQLLLNKMQPIVEKNVARLDVGTWEEIRGEALNMLGMAVPFGAAGKLAGGAARGISQGLNFGKVGQVVTHGAAQATTFGALMAGGEIPESVRAQWEAASPEQQADAERAWRVQQFVHGAALGPLLALTAPIAQGAGRVAGRALGRFGENAPKVMNQLGEQLTQGAQVGRALGEGATLGGAFPVYEEVTSRLWEQFEGLGEMAEEKGLGDEWGGDPVTDTLRAVGREAALGLNGEQQVGGPVTEFIKAVSSGDWPGAVEAAKEYARAAAPGAIGFTMHNLLSAARNAQSFATNFRVKRAGVVFEQLERQMRREGEAIAEGAGIKDKEGFAEDMVKGAKERLGDLEPDPVPKPDPMGDLSKKIGADMAEKRAGEDATIRAIMGEDVQGPRPTPQTPVPTEQYRVGEIGPKIPTEGPEIPPEMRPRRFRDSIEEIESEIQQIEQNLGGKNSVSPKQYDRLTVLQERLDRIKTEQTIAENQLGEKESIELRERVWGTAEKPSGESKRLEQSAQRILDMRTKGYDEIFEREQRVMELADKAWEKGDEGFADSWLEMIEPGDVFRFGASQYSPKSLSRSELWRFEGRDGSLIRLSDPHGVEVVISPRGILSKRDGMMFPPRRYWIPSERNRSRFAGYRRNSDRYVETKLRTARRASEERSLSLNLESLKRHEREVDTLEKTGKSGSEKWRIARGMASITRDVVRRQVIEGMNNKPATKGSVGDLFRRMQDLMQRRRMANRSQTEIGAVITAGGVIRVAKGDRGAGSFHQGAVDRRAGVDYSYEPVIYIHTHPSDSPTSGTDLRIAGAKSDMSAERTLRVGPSGKKTGWVEMMVNPNNVYVYERTQRPSAAQRRVRAEDITWKAMKFRDIPLTLREAMNRFSKEKSETFATTRYEVLNSKGEFEEWVLENYKSGGKGEAILTQVAGLRDSYFKDVRNRAAKAGIKLKRMSPDEAAEFVTEWIKANADHPAIRDLRPWKQFDDARPELATKLFAPRTPVARAALRSAQSIIDGMQRYEWFTPGKGSAKEVMSRLDAMRKSGADGKELAAEIERLHSERPRMGGKKLMLNGLHRMLTKRMGNPSGEMADSLPELFTDRMEVAFTDWVNAVSPMIDGRKDLQPLYAWRDTVPELFEGASSLLMPLETNGKRLLRDMRNAEKGLYGQRGHLAIPLPDFHLSENGFVRSFVRSLFKSQIAESLIKEGMRAPTMSDSPWKGRPLTDAVITSVLKTVMPGRWQQTRDFFSNPQTYAGFVGRDAMRALSAASGRMLGDREFFFNAKTGLLRGMKERDAQDVRMREVIRGGPDSEAWKNATPEEKQIAHTYRKKMQDIKEEAARYDPWVQFSRKEANHWGNTETIVKNDLYKTNRKRMDADVRETQHSLTEEIKSLDRQVRDRGGVKKAPEALVRRLHVLQRKRANDIRKVLGRTPRELRGAEKAIARELKEVTELKEKWEQRYKDFKESWGQENYVHDMARMEALDVIAGIKGFDSLDWTSKQQREWIEGKRSERLGEKQRDAAKNDMALQRLILEPFNSGTLDMLSHVESRHAVVRSWMKKRTGKLEELGLVEPSLKRSTWSYIHEVYMALEQNKLLRQYEDYLWGSVQPLDFQQFVVEGGNKIRGTEAVVGNMRMAMVGFGLPKMKGQGVSSFNLNDIGEAATNKRMIERKVKSAVGVDRKKKIEDTTHLLLMHIGDQLPSKEKLADPDWFAKNAHRFKIVPKNRIRTRVRVWQDGILGEMRKLDNEFAKGDADRLQSFIEKDFLTSMQMLRQGAQTGVESGSTRWMRGLDKAIRMINAHTSAQALGGITNGDNAFKAGGGGLLLAYLTLGKLPTNPQAWKGLATYERAARKVHSYVAGKAQEAQLSGDKLSKLMLKEIERSPDELAKMSPKKRQRVQWTTEALQSLIESGIMGGNRGDQIGQMFTDVKSWMSDRPIGEAKIVEPGKKDVRNAVIKLSEAHFLAFNVAERMARILPYLDVYVSSRQQQMTKQEAANRAFVFTNATQMVFNRVTKAPWQNTPVGALWANLGSWAINWSGRLLNLPASAQAAFLVKSFGAVWLANQLGLDFRELLGGTSQDLEAIPYIGDNLVNATTDEDFNSMFFPLPIFTGGPTMSAGRAVLKAADAKIDGMDYEAAEWMHRAYRNLRPDRAGWIQDLQRYAWGADLPLGLSEPYEDNVQPDPGGGAGRATPVQPGFATFLQQQLPLLNKVRDWEITMAARQQAELTRRLGRERTNVGDEIGRLHFEAERAERQGNLDLARGLRRQRDEEFRRYREFTTELKARDVSREDVTSILRRGEATAKVPRPLRSLAGSYPRTDEGHEGFFLALSAALRDPEVRIDPEHLSAVMSLRWASGTQGMAKFMVRLRGSNKRWVYDELNEALKYRQKLWKKLGK